VLFGPNGCSFLFDKDIASRTRRQTRVPDPRRKIRNEERGGVGLGMLDGDAGSSTADEGSHPVADGRRHRAHSARGCTSTSEV
jgi:hypothetical protein